jgi:putative transposase
MPRQSREKSSSGIYHVMVRGINRQDIFHDDNDKQNYIVIMRKYKDLSHYELYGYCLMSNHVHLLIREYEESISQVMKRIGTSYVYWYNMKYERSGHLFQGRFQSESVEDDNYLLVVLRYIHLNPVKAGLVEEAADYKWSSYSEYFHQKNNLTDTSFILSLFDPHKNKAVKIFEDFMARDNEDKCLDVGVKKRKQLSDEETKELISLFTSSDNIQALLQMEKSKRNKVLKDLKGRGVSIRQLARITGLGRRIVERA